MILNEREIWKIKAIQRPLLGVLQGTVQVPWMGIDADPVLCSVWILSYWCSL